MKRSTLLFLTFVLLFNFSACGEQNASSPASGSAEQTNASFGVSVPPSPSSELSEAQTPSSEISSDEPLETSVMEENSGEISASNESGSNILIPYFTMPENVEYHRCGCRRQRQHCRTRRQSAG